MHFHEINQFQMQINGIWVSKCMLYMYLIQVIQQMSHLTCMSIASVKLMKKIWWVNTFVVLWSYESHPHFFRVSIFLSTFSGVLSECILSTKMAWPTVSLLWLQWFNHSALQSIGTFMGTRYFLQEWKRQHFPYNYSAKQIVKFDTWGHGLLQSKVRICNCVLNLDLVIRAYYLWCDCMKSKDDTLRSQNSKRMVKLQQSLIRWVTGQDVFLNYPSDIYPS